MPDDSMRTVLVALGSGFAVALAKACVAVVSGSSAMAAEAAHSLSDTANDLFLFVARSWSPSPVRAGRGLPRALTLTMSSAALRSSRWSAASSRV
jgi:hypothetical protein